MKKRNKKSTETALKALTACMALILAMIVAAIGAITSKAGTKDTYIKQEYVQYCEKIGQQYGIAPELLEALIETESGGKADAVSRTGDIGLCQINPRWSTYTKKELLDPYTNINAAAEILVGLFEKHDIGGLMAYNVGEYSGTFRKHMQEGTLTEYAEKIINRSDYLQKIHEEGEDGKR